MTERRRRGGRGRRKIPAKRPGELDAGAVEFLPTESLALLKQYNCERRRSWLHNIHEDEPCTGRVAVQRVVRFSDVATKIDILMNGRAWVMWLFPDMQPHYNDYRTVLEYAPALTMRFWELGGGHLLLVEIAKPRRGM